MMHAERSTIRSTERHARARGWRAARGFTLIEVVVAAGLLSIVGLAIVAFVTAFARGASARARISDPAIEGALLAERLRAVAPGLRAPLASDGETAALWLSDNVPSRTVHLSELGWLRFDSEMGDVVLERVDERRLADD
ncbi:MAG: prepilin-type N-terminal cleavage/methylation domain-containing protein, partial [bacterium]